MLDFQAMPDHTTTRRPSLPAIAVWAGIFLLAACLPPGAQAKSLEADSQNVRNADDLVIVDCLLPPKVRRLGRRSTYLAPRQPVRTTAVQCRIRGGEYTEPDQASLATALKVWLPQAKAGDAEAQFYVGQIFEKGLGVAPDYESARTWYLKAAEQSYAAAQINLGYLYEAGLGVEKDELAALGWYRKAAGLTEDLVVLGEDDYEALLRAREELTAKSEEVEELKRQIDELNQQIGGLESQSAEEQERTATLHSIVDKLQSELAEREKEMATRNEQVASLEEALATAPTNAPSTAAPATDPNAIDFGRYHALVIGNQSYQKLPPLETAANDARQVADVLESQYGFEVQLLIDATRYDTMTALNDLREKLTSEDNLLVYYAGHGNREDKGHAGYWQPVDADPRNPSNWIPNEVVTEHLDLVPAKHVLVVADAQYSGLRTRSSVARLPTGMTDEERFHHIRLMLERRSRLVLTSGALRPDPRQPENDTSRFSHAFLDVLRNNGEVLEASKIYRAVNQQLVPADGSRAPYVPEFATMRWARNNVADFFFVPQRTGS